MSIEEGIKIDEKVKEDDDDNLELVVKDEGGSPNLVIKDEARVILDTDDAPFLEEEIEEEPEPPAALSSVGDFSELLGEEKSGWSKKKKIIVFGSVSIFVLFAIAAALWWFMFRNPVVIVEKVILEPQIIVIPSVTEEVAPKEFYIDLEPFLVELKNDQGNPVFLVFKFTAFTKDQRLSQEAANKFLVLRDAVYYYLINKTHSYLVNPANVDVIKNDISSVLSGYLAGGKIDDILFESYLTK